MLAALAVFPAGAGAQGKVPKPPKGMVAAEVYQVYPRTGQGYRVPGIKPQNESARGSYAGVYDTRGRLMAKDDWNSFVFLSERHFMAKHKANYKLWLFDRQSGKGRETEYQIVEPIAEMGAAAGQEGGAIYVASNGFYDRTTSGPTADRATDVFLLDADFEEVGALYNVGGDTAINRTRRNGPELEFVMGYGEQLLVQYEAPDGTALSRLYSRKGQPLGPELPRVLMTFTSGSADNPVGPMTIVLQSSPMAHPAMFRNMLWRPMKQDGSGLVELPSGALGMFPVTQTTLDMSAIVSRGGNPDDHVFVPQIVQGWGVVFVEGGAPKFVVSPASAEETARLAPSLPRYADLALAQVYGGRLAFAARDVAGGPWRALDTKSLQPIGAPSANIVADLDQVERAAAATKIAAARKADDDLTARKALEASREAARVVAVEAARAEAQQRAAAQQADYVRRYDQAMKNNRLDLARAAAWALGDCTRYRAAWRNWLISANMGELDQASSCGISEASITEAGGPALAQRRRDIARQQALEGFRDAVQAFGRAVDAGAANTDPDVSVRIYEGGRVRQEVMPISHYEKIYGNR